MQKAPKRGAGPAGDPDTDEDDEVIDAIIDESRPPRRREAEPPPPEEAAEVPDGPRSWGDLHGPTLYIVGCLVVMGALMALQSNC